MISELVSDLEQVEDDAALVADVTVRRQRVFVALDGSTQVAVFRHQVSEVAQRHCHIFLVAELTGDGQALLVRALRPGEVAPIAFDIGDVVQRARDGRLAPDFAEDRQRVLV